MSGTGAVVWGEWMRQLDACWQESPKARPTFATLTRTLRDAWEELSRVCPPMRDVGQLVFATLSPDDILRKSSLMPSMGQSA